MAENLPASPIVITGINAITRNLEKKDPDDSDAILFVCRGDIDPSQLCAHFPQLSALASRKLVSLQQGAETAISSALGLKRVSAVQMRVSTWRLSCAHRNPTLTCICLGFWGPLGAACEGNYCYSNFRCPMARIQIHAHRNQNSRDQYASDDQAEAET